MSGELSVGLGTTANCNLGCAHCYSRPLRGHSLSLAELKRIIEGGDKRIGSINFGTGENILNPEFGEMVAYCHERGIKLSVTSNGYTINQLSDEQLGWFNDIDISLDFPDKAEQNRFRKGDSWDFVDQAINRCRRLRIEFSIATALMTINFREIPDLLERASREECNLRVNVFKPVPKAGIYRFQLDYGQFWEAMALLFDHGRLISCSEPIVNAVLGIAPNVPQSPCGKQSLRIHPDGEVVPCVYWINSDQPIDIYTDLGDPQKVRTVPREYWTTSRVHIRDLTESFEPAFNAESFVRIRTVPEFCRAECSLVEICGGGCASRRYLNGRLSEPDDYCPFYRGAKPPSISVRWHPDQKELIHSNYLCTLIFAG